MALAGHFDFAQIEIWKFLRKSRRARNSVSCNSVANLTQWKSIRNKAFPPGLAAVASLILKSWSIVVRNKITIVTQGIESISIRVLVQAVIAGTGRFLQAS